TSSRLARHQGQRNAQQAEHQWHETKGDALVQFHSFSDDFSALAPFDINSRQQILQRKLFGAGFLLLYGTDQLVEINFEVIDIKPCFAEPRTIFLSTISRTVEQAHTQGVGFLISANYAYLANNHFFSRRVTLVDNKNPLSGISGWLNLFDVK